MADRIVYRLNGTDGSVLTIRAEPVTPGGVEMVCRDGDGDTTAVLLEGREALRVASALQAAHAESEGGEAEAVARALRAAQEAAEAVTGGH